MSLCLLGDSQILSEPIAEEEEFQELESKIALDSQYRQEMVRLYLLFFLRKNILTKIAKFT